MKSWECFRDLRVSGILRLHKLELLYGSHGLQPLLAVILYYKCRFGGAKQGVEENVNAGDVIVIPAGLAHERSLCECLAPTHFACPCTRVTAVG